MSTLLKVIGSAIVLAAVVIIAIVGPVLALTMAYLLWGIKGALFTLGLLLSK